MIINYLHKIGWFVGLVLLQVLILNNVHIAGYATPFLYIYLILIKLIILMHINIFQNYLKNKTSFVE